MATQYEWRYIACDQYSRRWSYWDGLYEVVSLNTPVFINDYVILSVGGKLYISLDAAGTDLEDDAGPFDTLEEAEAVLIAMVRMDLQ